jgi:cell division protein FtsQ
VAGVVALGLLGWQWRANVTVDRVAVTGAQHAPPDTLRRLARVGRGTAMRAVAPMLVADRVARHPWVKEATAETQWMQGALTIAVTERTPAALAVDAQGRPAYYLDRSGHAMPLPDSAGYDVPLVRGLEAEAPWTQPDTAQTPSSLRRVLRALPEAGVADLVAEIEMQPAGAPRERQRVPKTAHAPRLCAPGARIVAGRADRTHRPPLRWTSGHPNAPARRIMHAIRSS